MDSLGEFQGQPPQQLKNSTIDLHFNCLNWRSAKIASCTCPAMPVRKLSSRSGLSRVCLYRTWQAFGHGITAWTPTSSDLADSWLDYSSCTTLALTLRSTGHIGLIGPTFGFCMERKSGWFNFWKDTIWGTISGTCKVLTFSSSASIMPFLGSCQKYNEHVSSFALKHQQGSRSKIKRNFYSVTKLDSVRPVQPPWLYPWAWDKFHGTDSPWRKRTRA